MSAIGGRLPAALVLGLLLAAQAAAGDGSTAKRVNTQRGSVTAPRGQGLTAKQAFRDAEIAITTGMATSPEEFSAEMQLFGFEHTLGHTWQHDSDSTARVVLTGDPAGRFMTLQFLPKQELEFTPEVLDAIRSWAHSISINSPSELVFETTEGSELESSSTMIGVGLPRGTWKYTIVRCIRNHVRQ